MSNNQKPVPVLIKDLGMMYSNTTSRRKERYGLYKCSCGNEFKALTGSVKRGNTASCGCYQKQQAIKTKTTHGLSNHPLHSVWHNIITRTTNPKHNSFKNYGDRGIVMCEEWKNNRQSFYDWCYENGYAKGLEIDRLDNNGNYEPSNCRFVTNSVNQQNTRRIRSTNTSGYRGVSFNKENSKWATQIRTNGKAKHLGYYLTALEAAIVYDTYVKANKLEHTINGVIE